MRVTDTGVGIAEVDQQVIFEKFRQGSVGVPSGDAMAREYSGSGLGLSIVKELCKLLGGAVSVASELGKGSTFTVRIPWTLAEPARADAPVSVDFEQVAPSRFE
jgi:signal transduction histidine kinase